MKYLTFPVFVYIYQLYKNINMKADCCNKSKKRFKPCQLNYESISGTMISFRQAVNKLDRALAQPINN